MSDSPMSPITDEEELLIKFVHLHNKLATRIIDSGIHAIPLSECVGLEDTVKAAGWALVGIKEIVAKMEADAVDRFRCHDDHYNKAVKFAYAVTQLYTVLDLQDAIPERMGHKIEDILSDAAMFLEESSMTMPSLVYEDEIPF